MIVYEGLTLWKYRIQRDLDHFDGVLPERFAVAWRAHLAGYAEWGNLTDEGGWGVSVAGYRELLAMIPPVYDDPAERIARLHDGAPRADRFAPMSDALDADLAARIRRDLEAFGDPLPEREAIAWDAYLGALMLTHAISLDTLYDLRELLPEVPDSPARRLFGWHGDWDNLIQNDKNRFGDPLPERYAIAWRGYLTALWEWGEINRRKYDELLALVPARDDPSGDIAREQDHARWRVEGRRVTSDEVQRELAARIRHDIDYFVGELPERFAIAWQAYLLALYREDILTEDARATLWEMTPAVPDDPVVTVFFKRED